jgi:hypothetical protein
MNDVRKKMAVLEQKLLNGEFAHRKHFGNELSCYIFDYPPQEELTVRSYVNRLVRQSPWRIVNVNLFEAVVQMVDADAGIDVVMELEAEEGSEAVQQALWPMLDSDRLIRFIADRARDADVLFLTGAGSLYPLLRSHVVLNRLHERVTDIPVVLFFPGTYSGMRLKLFDLLDDDHYYRALRISGA